jgi:hypothetical protein
MVMAESDGLSIGARVEVVHAGETGDYRLRQGDLFFDGLLASMIPSFKETRTSTGSIPSRTAVSPVRKITIVPASGRIFQTGWCVLSLSIRTLTFTAKRQTFVSKM